MNIVRELMEGKYPELLDLRDIAEELRSLAVEVKKKGMSIAQASLGIKFFERLRKLGIAPEYLEEFVNICEGISPEFAEAALRLRMLEKKLGKSFEKILLEFTDRLSKLKMLNSSIKALEERKKALENELKELERRKSMETERLKERIRGVESLERIGIERVCRISSFASEFEKLGYNAEKLAEVARLADKREMLRREVFRLRSEINRLTAEFRGLFAARLILETRTIPIRCPLCSGTALFRLPEISELADAMGKGVAFPTRCPFCGFVNYLNPRDLVAYIGWSILLQ